MKINSSKFLKNKEIVTFSSGENFYLYSIGKSLVYIIHVVCGQKNKKIYNISSLLTQQFIQ